MLAAPASSVASAIRYGQFSGPLAAPVVRDLGRGGYKRMARDLQQAFRETAHATQDILRPIQTQGIVSRRSTRWRMRWPHWSR